MTISPDSNPTPRPGVARGIALLAVLAVIVGVALAYGPRLTSRRPSTPLGTAAPADTSEGAISKALGATLSHEDSINRWVDIVPGAALAGLDADRRRMFVRYANAERCSCGCGYTLAGCREYDSSCEVSGPRVAALLDSVRTGQIRTAKGLREKP